MFNNSQKTKTAKLARLKNTGKFGYTVSVFNMSVVIVVRLFRSFSFCSVCSASSSYAMHGNNLIACHNLTPNRTAYPADSRIWHTGRYATPKFMYMQFLIFGGLYIPL